MLPWASTPWAALDLAPEAGAGAVPALPAERLAAGDGPLFAAVEIELYAPGGAETLLGEPWAATAWGTLSTEPLALESTELLRASDLGWVTQPGDPPGVVVHPPILAAAFELDRAVALAPDGSGAGAAWGEVRLINDGSLDALATSRNSDGRPVRLRMGRKQRLPHGYLADPPWAETVQVFGGIGSGFRLEDRGLRIALRDASYWAERPASGAAYGGTGGLDGTDALAGKRKPQVRGGTALAPVRHVTPVLVDPAALIYQYTDGAGTVEALYEGGHAGAGGYVFAGNVADLYSGSTAAGEYRTDNARGLFQLGTQPLRAITVDCTGAFPSGTVETSAALLAWRMLLEDAAVPAIWLEEAAFRGLHAAQPWTAGYALGLDEQLDAIALAGRLLASLSARLVPSRTGRLSVMSLRAVPPGTRPAYAYTPAEVIACREIPLGAPLDPPPYRVRVGWARNHTVQDSDLSPLIDPAVAQAIAEPWQVASWVSTAVQAAWRRPSDPDVLDSDLLDGGDASALALLIGGLWAQASPRRLFEVAVPLVLALRHDLGAVLSLTYPLPGLSAGALGLQVGEAIRRAEGIATLRILV
jgi:hypothetical protein